MKRLLAAAGLTTALAMAGCGQGPAAESPAADEAAADTAARVAPVAEAVSSETPAVTPKPVAPGAPSFAVIYPGGIPSGPATIAQGPGGPGGIVSFTTASSPDAIIAYYRKTAEAAGLASVMAMNQGEARAYGAAAEDGSSKLLRVVATPMENGETNVQLDWTAGG
ncbi:MAG: hypothetical protein PSV23_00060 [Brevundimonas sp.]|uniref:hypothetical protein n=1 Tax=Brevundimonas sp. TaxID=1871086 RepID=UPI002488D34B|nr:hypothetical protein [Brevundimonas sp.]MDI1325182.1 hypothetical protein [Brevundimonas sp.]